MITSKRQFWDVFLIKLFFNLRSEASKSNLNYIWWILEPLLYVGVLYLVFGLFMDRGGNGFILFLICGQVPFLWFSKSVQNASNSIMSNKALINQTAIPKILFPLLTVSQDMVKQSVVFILLLCLLCFFNTASYSTWFYFPIILVTQFTLILAVSFFVASIVPFIPDFKYLVSTGMMLLMFGSGIFYDYKKVLLPEYHQIFLLNPMANLINSYRGVLLEEKAPELFPLLVTFFSSIIFILLMRFIFNKYEHAFSRRAI